MLQVGTKAVDFTLLDTFGNEVSLKDFLGKKVVLYFYPKDLTGGCSLQAQDYQKMYEEYQKENIVVLGVSKDPIKSHVKFVDKYGLKFTLLSDEDLKVIQAYEVWGEKKLYGKPYMGVIRTTYVINEEGIIVYANNKVKAATDAETTFEVIKNLK